MGLLVIVLVFRLVVSELVVSCPQPYEGIESGKHECINNVKLYENYSTSGMLMQWSDFTEMVYSNRTYNKVTVILPKNCKSNFLSLNYPSLVAMAIEVKDTNLTVIKINVNAQCLKVIDLSSNKLNTIDEEFLNVFINLKELNLRNNKIQCIKEESLSGLTKLETLDLSGNKLKVINNFLAPLKTLQQLNLSKNNIESIREYSFTNFLLQNLDISHNKLREVGPGVLQLLPSLVRLLLSDNPDLGNAPHDTQLLVGSGRWLQQIDASRTGLHRVPEAFTHSVRFLSLTGNTIAAVRCGDFDSYPLLQSLDLSDNKIDFVEEDSLGRMEMLILLNLNNNQLTSVPKSLSEKLIHLSLNRNLVKNLTKVDFEDLKNLNILLLQNNKITYIEAYAFADLSALKVLDLSNNPIQILAAEAFEGPLALLDLRLCYLNITVPEKDGAFPMTTLESLRMLHLKSSANLARQLLADTTALTALSHLHYLDLRMNNQSEIPNDLLFYLGKLKTLRLHGNGFNCSGELWLRDWLNWTGSVANGETCYYANADPKDEVECKCFFPEKNAFQSDSLPSINSYSTEIINRLLKHYDYDEIKSETSDVKKFKKNTTEKKIKLTTTDKVKLNTKENNIIRSLYPSKTVKNDEPQSFPKLSNTSEAIRSELNSIYNEVTQYRSKHSLGRGTKTPGNITVVQTNENIKRHIKQINDPKNRSDTVSNKIHEEENIVTSENSPYKSDREYLHSCIGIASMAILMIASLVLIIRLKKRRKNIDEKLEQAEIAYISGGSWEDLRVTDDQSFSWVE